MITDAQKDAVLSYIDDEDNVGRWVEVDEVEDVLRAFPGAPKDEGLLQDLARDVLVALIQDGVIVAYGKRNHPTDMRFKIAPREEA